MLEFILQQKNKGEIEIMDTSSEGFDLSEEKMRKEVIRKGWMFFKRWVVLASLVMLSGLSIFVIGYFKNERLKARGIRNYNWQKNAKRDFITYLGGMLPTSVFVVIIGAIAYGGFRKTAKNGQILMIRLNIDSGIKPFQFFNQALLVSFAGLFVPFNTFKFNLENEGGKYKNTPRFGKLYSCELPYIDSEGNSYAITGTLFGKTVYLPVTILKKDIPSSAKQYS